MISPKLRIAAWILEAIALAFGVYLCFTKPTPLNLVLTLVGGAIGIWNIESFLRSYDRYSRPDAEMPPIKLVLIVMVLIFFGLGGMYWAYRSYLNGEVGTTLFNFGFALALLILAWKAAVSSDNDG